MSVVVWWCGGVRRRRVSVCGGGMGRDCGSGGMGRQRMLKQLTAPLAALVLALPQRTEAFYLPGVAPYEYKDSEKVRVPLLCSQRVVGASLHPAAT